MELQGCCVRNKIDKIESINPNTTTYSTKYNYAYNMILQKKAISNSGTAGLFLEIYFLFVDKNLTKIGIVVCLPDMNTIKLSQTALLKWSILTDNARQAHIFKELKKLISISK